MQAEGAKGERMNVTDGASAALAVLLLAAPVALLVFLVANPVWALFLTGVALVIASFFAMGFAGVMAFLVLLVAGLILLGLGAIARTGGEIAARMDAGQHGQAKQLAEMQATLERIATANEGAANMARQAALTSRLSENLMGDRP